MRTETESFLFIERKRIVAQMFIGVDVSKDFLDIHDGKKSYRIANEKKAIQKFIKTLENIERVVLESTGSYHLMLVQGLLDAEIPVSIVNPKRVRNFAKCLGNEAKTDAIDAKILFEFACKFSETLPQVSRLSEEEEKLKNLVGSRQDLVKTEVQMKQRISVLDKIAGQYLQPVLKTLQEQLQLIEQEIETLLRSISQSQVLKSVKSVGPVLSATLIAHLPELGKLSGQEIASLVGLAPFNRDSGRYNGRRRIYGGREGIRPVLYMATMGATRWNPQIKPFYERLIEKGKPFKVAMTACMRKLLVILNAKMRDWLKEQALQTV
jgi:transposase